jgi:hypothetical protein
MPRNPSVLLREELDKLNIELLDIYSFREHDVIRVRSKTTGRVILYTSKRKVNTLATREDVVKLVEEISRQVRG